MSSSKFKGMVVGKPGKLSESLNYPEDGISRQEILSNKKVNIIQFAFSEEKGLVTNKAQDDIFVHVIEGILEVDLDGKEFTVHEGEYIVLPEGKPHSLEADIKTKILFMITGD